MKQHNSHAFLVMFFVVILFPSCFSVSSRLLVRIQGEREEKAKDIAHGMSPTELKDEFELMGGPTECHEQNAECLSRRMIAEAHLDYIYTQHHEP